MWPFRPRKPISDDSALFMAKLANLEERLKRVEEDWLLTYDKFRRLLQRLYKRARDDEPAEDNPGQAPDPFRAANERILRMRGEDAVRRGLSVGGRLQQGPGGREG